MADPDAPEHAAQPVEAEQARRLLEQGRLELLGRIPWASNATMLARARLGQEQALAIYKPERGERPLWDFPPGLYRRELAAYLLSEALGWGLVPLTVVRDGPLGVGSLQLLIECQDEVTAFDLLSSGHPDMPTVATFDVVANNADRKAGHTLLSAEGKVWAIDHGVCFHEQPKLRTVVWDFAGEPVPEPLRDDLGRLCGELLAGQLGAELADLLSPAELRALGARADRLAAEGVFPAPGSGRSYPWPLV